MNQKKQEENNQLIDDLKIDFKTKSYPKAKKRD